MEFTSENIRQLLKAFGHCPAWERCKEASERYKTFEAVPMKRSKQMSQNLPVVRIPMLQGSWEDEVTGSIGGIC